MSNFRLILSETRPKIGQNNTYNNVLPDAIVPIRNGEAPSFEAWYVTPRIALLELISINSAGIYIRFFLIFTLSFLLSSDINLFSSFQSFIKVGKNLTIYKIIDYLFLISPQHNDTVYRKLKIENLAHIAFISSNLNIKI